MADGQISRRRWLAVSPLGAGWVPILAAQEHAHEAIRSAEPAVLSVFSAAEASAISSQIIPSGDSPGAREAGAIYFIHRALATFDSDKRGLYTTGLEEAERKRAELFPGPNLFLVDGGSLVTASCQPTCTIQALAYRAAESIAGQARKAAI